MSLRLPSRTNTFKPVRRAPTKPNPPTIHALPSSLPSEPPRPARQSSIPPPSIIPPPTIASQPEAAPSAPLVGLFPQLASSTPVNDPAVNGSYPAALGHSKAPTPVPETIPPAPVSPRVNFVPTLQSSIPPTSRRDVSRASVLRTGRPALIAAAENHTSTGRSPGRLPPRTSTSTASSTHGLPPTLRPSSPPSTGRGSLPPSLAAGPSRRSTPAATPAPDPASMAAALVASIRPISGSEPPPRRTPVLKRKRAPNGQAVKRVRKTVASEHNYEEGRVSDGVLGTSSSRWEEKRKADAARPSKILRRRPNLSEMDVDNAASADESADEEAVEEQAVESEGTRPIVRKRRGTYNARTVAGTPFDKRIKANAHKRKQPYAPARTHPELDGVQANEMVGIQVDPHAMTMKDLATKLLSEGKVSSRALKLHAFQREEEERKRMERFERAEATWRCKQIQRRKLRAEHNADRARRREEMGSTGDDEDEVSADSDDSEETFEPQPDRMTPPSSPEPPGRISPSRIPSEHHHEEEDEGEDRATAGLEDEEGNDEAAVEENMDVAPRADEDEADAELRAAGFLVSSDVRPEDRGDEEEDEEIDWDMHQDDIEALRVQREEERRRIREEMGERAVEEQDDETTMVNAATFGKRQSVSERWTSEETEFFYMVLGETGENYTLMKAYFPGRDVKQLKRKGLRENRDNTARMTAAILNRRPLDKVYLAKSAGYDDTRSWEREDALFEEARRDVEKLKGFGSTVTEFESGDLASQLEEEIRQADGDEELPPRYGE